MHYMRFILYYYITTCLSSLNSMDNIKRSKQDGQYQTV
jgi:hypothetical protein